MEIYYHIFLNVGLNAWDSNKIWSILLIESNHIFSFS